MFTSLLLVKINHAFLCPNISAFVHGAILTQVVRKISETFLMLSMESCNRLSVLFPLPALQTPVSSDRAAGLFALAVPFSYAYTSLRCNFKEA